MYAPGSFYKGINHSINSQFQYLYEPNKNRLFSQKFSGENEINSIFLFYFFKLEEKISDNCG